MSDTPLACPDDRAPLRPTADGLTCSTCSRTFTRNEEGYFVLGRLNAVELAQDTTTEEHAAGQAGNAGRLYETYLRPWLLRGAAHDILDAGCGLGMDVEFMLQDNLNAYGVDLPRVSRFWRERGYPADHFICGGVLALPFPDERFDAVLSLGVIEHIGTTTGHCTLADDWQQQRLTFVRELLRVLRPGGRLLLACPNKWFPIDVQHGVYDGVTRAPLREAIYNRTGMNIHRTWGRYHLPSYGDVGRWFAGYRWQTLPLSGYFGFGFLDRRGAGDWLRRGVTRCIDDFPSVLRQTPLNPYILIEVSKPGLAELA